MDIKNRRNNHIWQSEEDDYLRNNYLLKSYPQIAMDLGMTKRQVSSHIMQLGLRLPEEIFNQRAKLSRFKKGHVSWNKGLRGRCFINSGQFPKNHLPHNTLHDGAITLRSDKTGRCYKYIRVKKGEWKELHRYVWETEKGKVPGGFVICFKDGDSLNTDIANLALISRAEILKRNRPGDLYSNPAKYKTDKDEFIAGLLGYKNTKEKRDFIQKFPEIIKMKRAELKLKKELRNATRIN